jgi:hemoglobin-like flavoprotein
MDAEVVRIYEESLERCSSNPRFLERFYEIFLACSPKIAEKFKNTDFARQREALNGSLHAMVLAVRDEGGLLEKHLAELAEKHSSRGFGIGSELYDYWLDSLLAAVKETDPQYDKRVHDAWERVMLIGIEYMLSRYA